MPSCSVKMIRRAGMRGLEPMCAERTLLLQSFAWITCAVSILMSTKAPFSSTMRRWVVMVENLPTVGTLANTQDAMRESVVVASAKDWFCRFHTATWWSWEHIAIHSALLSIDTMVMGQCTPSEGVYGMSVLLGVADSRSQSRTSRSKPTETIKRLESDASKKTSSVCPWERHLVDEISVDSPGMSSSSRSSGERKASQSARAVTNTIENMAVGIHSHLSERTAVICRVQISSTVDALTPVASSTITSGSWI